MIDRQIIDRILAFLDIITFVNIGYNINADLMSSTLKCLRQIYKSDKYLFSQNDLNRINHCKNIKPIINLHDNKFIENNFYIYKNYTKYKVLDVKNENIFIFKDNSKYSISHDMINAWWNTHEKYLELFIKSFNNFVYSNRNIIEGNKYIINIIKKKDYIHKYHPNLLCDIGIHVISLPNEYHIEQINNITH